MVSEYANTSKSVKVANKIKKQRDVTIPRLTLWNYDACEHHDTPRADCEYRKCGNDFFSHQRVTIAWLYAIKKGLLASSPGTGKAQPLSSKILTPSGWKTMGDMQVGSEVLTPDGSTSRVVAIYPQGVQPIYKITFSDGSSTRATGDHLWRVRARGQWRTVTTESILHGTKQPLDSGRMLPVSPIIASDGRLTYTIPSTTLNTPDVPLSLPPYLLGALLGDGGLKSSHVSITSMDEELIGKVRDLASQFNTKLVFVADSGKAKTYLLVRESAEVTYNPIRKELKNMGLLGAGSRDKFIPTQYLHASYSQRLELLRGLMDTDGSRDTTNEFSSVSYALAHGVASLVRSLGGYAYLRKRNTSWTHNGAKKTGTCWRVTFNIPVNPFGTSAHSDLYTGPGQKQRRIMSIVPDGVEEAQCILIDHSDHLYITDEYIVTHNTNCILGTLCLLKEKNEMPRRAIIVVNTPSVKQWAAEAARFAPGLRVEAVVGGTKKSERVEAYGGTWDVLIVGFHMMLRDMELLRKIKPSVVMTDDVDPLLNDTTKAQPLSSKVLTREGWVEMGNVREGTYVLTPSGKRARVQKVFPHGKKSIFKVTLNDGSTTRATEDHLWQVQYRLGGTLHNSVVTTKNMIDLFDSVPNISFKLPLTEPSGHNKALPVDPYVLGCLLGDGSLSAGTHFACSDEDVELLDLFRDALPPYMEVRRNPSSEISYYCADTKSDGYNPYAEQCLMCSNQVKVVSRRLCMQHYDSLRKANILDNAPRVYPKPNENRLTSAIKVLGLYGVSCADKYIPDLYKFSSYDSRLSLLQGLMDTDGCAGTNSGYKFAAASKSLAEGVRDLVLSLGGVASAVQHTPPEKLNHQSYRRSLSKEQTLDIKSNHGIYVVHFNFENGVVPFRLTRKIKKSNLDSKIKNGRRIVSIVPDGVEEAQCIMIDDADHLYITDNYISTHNCHKALVELTEDVDRVVVSNASSVGTDLIQIHSSMMPIGGKYIWGPKDMFENNFIQKEWEKVQVGTEVYYNKQGDRISKPKYVSKSKVRGVKNAPQPVDCPVLTPSGWRPMGDISVGDFVIGSSGHPVKVIGKTGVTNEPVYKVHLSQGQWAEATADHLWAVEQLQVSASHQNRMRVVKTKDLMGRKKGYCLPLYGGFYNGTYKASVSPYLMGVLLGDGTISDGKCGFTTGSHSDESLSLLGQVFNEVGNKNFWRVQESTDKASVFVSLSTPRGMRPRTAPDVCACGRPAFTKSRSLCASCYQIAWQKDRLLSAEKARAYIDPLIAGLRAEGVYGYVKENKKFPWQMLHASYEDRLALLQGLMDSDGTMIQDRGRATFTNRSKDLSDGVASLAQSFGLGFSRWEFINSAGNLCYGVHVSIKKAHPLFRLPYKLEAQMKSHEPYTSRSSRIVSVEYSRDADVQCLMLDSEDHLYVTKDYMLTHNSTFKKTLNPWFIRYTYDDISDVAMPEVAPVTNVWLDMHPEQRKRYDELRQGILKLLADGQEEIKEVQALQMFAQPLDSKVLTPTGWTTIGEIKAGDEVLTPEGFTAPVSGKSVVRKAPVYRVSTTNGGQTLASGDHLWEVSWRSVSGSTKKEKYLTKVMSTEEILEKGVLFSSPSLKNSRKRRFNLPSPSLFTPDVSLPVPAYTLGALLGDGRTGKHRSVSLTGNDLEIKERVMKELGTSFCYSFDKQDGVWHYSMRIATLDGRTSRKPNPLATYFRSVGLNVGATDKFIPEEYLHAGWQQRVDLLRGLMDTDGCAYQTNFVTASKRLADDVSALVRSLGGRAAIYTYAENKYTVDVNIHVNPFFLKRKASKWKPPHSAGIKIDSIEYVGEMDVQCIMVDSERHLYITDDYIVTHNTYGQQITAGLPVLGDEDGPGKSVKFDWLCKQMRGDWADEKVICFVRNKKAITALKARFAKLGIGTAEVSGNKVGDERQEEITRFWEDPNCRIIFCSAAGVRSLNLQCARIVCFLDIPSLNPESVHQAVGRARRAGGHSKVYPFFLLCNDTQEDHYEEVLQQRETISRWVWDSEDHLLPKMSAQEILRLIMP